MTPPRRPVVEFDRVQIFPGDVLLVTVPTNARALGEMDRLTDSIKAAFPEIRVVVRTRNVGIEIGRDDSPEL